MAAFPRLLRQLLEDQSSLLASAQHHPGRHSESTTITRLRRPLSTAPMAQASIIRLRLPGLRARGPREARGPRGAVMASGPSVMALSHLSTTSFSSHSAHYSGLDAPPQLLLRARQAAVNMGGRLGVASQTNGLGVRSFICAAWFLGFLAFPVNLPGSSVSHLVTP